MGISLRFLYAVFCAAFIAPAVANVATTAGSNLTAYNGTGAMNNNQWNSMMNARGNIPSSAPATANFGNCNAIILRCATPKCSSGSCSDMSVARPIVAGCVNSNDACKKYGNDLIEYITAQVVAQSNAKIMEQENAIAMAQAQATAQANAAAAAQNNAQMQQMQSQMVQMQAQMAESMAAMQEQMAAQSESQNAQIQNALAEQRNAMTAPATNSTGDTGAVIAGLEGLGVAEQLAAKNGISADILVREQMGGQIETAVEDAMVQMKTLKTTLDNILEYAGCDASASSCTGPRRVKKFKDLANEFFDPYEEVIGNIYDALILAMTLGIDVSDVIMLLSDSCNMWGKYVCEPCKNGDADCTCFSSDAQSNCYYRVKTDANGKVDTTQPHCRLVSILQEKDTVWREWIDANSGLTGSTQVACASDVVMNISLFRGMQKKATLDIETLRDLVNQDVSGVCQTPRNGEDFDVLEHCRAKVCNVDPEQDTMRWSQLTTAARTKKMPSDRSKWCFDDERDFKKLDNGGSSSDGDADTDYMAFLYCQDMKTESDCKNRQGCSWIEVAKIAGISQGTCVISNGVNKSSSGSKSVSNSGGNTKNTVSTNSPSLTGSSCSGLSFLDCFDTDSHPECYWDGTSCKNF